MSTTKFDVFPVGDQGVMLRFGDIASDEIHGRVLATDTAIQALEPTWLTETIPSYASLFVGYDPLVTDASEITKIVTTLEVDFQTARRPGKTWDIPICYDDEFGVDLDRVAEKTRLSKDSVISTHLKGEYRVYMYGFAPGYAYMGGTPDPIQLPRKSEPVRDIPSGSVLIAGAQCLVTTLTMPTGWWIIGRSPFPMFRPRAENPFPIAVGEKISFQRIGLDVYNDYLTDITQ